MARPLEANLVLHCGGHQVSYQDLQQVKTPDPEGIWHPLDHTTIFQTMMDALTTSKYQVMQSVHALSANGANYFGLAQVNADFLDTEEYGLVVGFRNSHNKQFSASMVAGAQVFVCDNLSFSGEVSFKHKHTTNVLDKLPELFMMGVGQLNTLYLNQERRYSAYKQHEFDPHKAEELIVNMYRQKIFNSRELGHMIDVYDNPSYDEYGKNTAWTMFNAGTEVVRGKLGKLPKVTMNLHQVLDGECYEELKEAA